MIRDIKISLKNLGFNENESTVYVALTQLGEATAAEVAKKANLPRTTVINILNKLHTEGCLTNNIYRGVTRYWIESPKSLANVFEYKIGIAKSLEDLLVNLYRTEAHFPFAKVYDTKDSIRKFVEKLIANMSKKSVIYTIDTPKSGNYTKIFSEGINNFIISEKNKKQVTTYSLVPYDSFGAIRKEQLTSQKIIVKEMPQGIDFKSSIWFIDDLLVLFSGNPPFVVVIKHEHIVPSLKSIYMYLWGVSNEY